MKKFNSIKNYLLLIIFTMLLAININCRNCLIKNSLIKSLPNFKGNDFPCIYSGFININEEKKTNIFYVLIKKMQDDSNSPLSIWLNGGPGISSMIGLFTDMGPFNLKRNGNTVDLNLNEMASWSRLSNILLVDQPVGTGFSFTNSENEIPKNQNDVSNQFYEFIQVFFSEHPEMSERDFYLLGENYAGKYIPDIADKIIIENDKIINYKSTQNPKRQRRLEDGSLSCIKYKINIKKIAIGNGLFDARYQRSSRKDLAKGINLLSEFDDESQYDFLSQQCEYELSNKSPKANMQCNKIMDYLVQISGDVDKYDVRKSTNSNAVLFENLNFYLNLEETVKEMHVKEKSIKKPGRYFTYENDEIKEIMKDDINLYSSLPKLEKIIDIHKIPIILFAGQFDLEEGPRGMERAIQSINFSFKEKFNNSPKSLWKIPIGSGKNVVAGYIKQYENLALITLRNAGHMAQLGRPGTVYDLLQHLFSDEKQWICPDDNCSLSGIKCSFMNNCNGNGHCDDTTAGKCKCLKEFYGPDCSLVVEPLVTGDYFLKPRQVRLLHMDDFQKDILIEIDSDDSNILISLLDKNEHEYIYEYEKHQVDYRMTNKKLILYLEKDKFFNSIATIQNLSFDKTIQLNTYIDFYSKFKF